MGCAASQDASAAPAKQRAPPGADVAKTPASTTGAGRSASAAPAHPTTKGKGKGERARPAWSKGKGKGRGKGRAGVREIIKGKFQVQLEGAFADYGAEEDAILKRAFLVGQPNARFRLRGQDYEYSFEHFTQKNLGTGKERRIRAPFGMFAPKTPVLPPGPMTVIVVPEGAGQSIEIQDPNNPGARIVVALPGTARPGAQVAVPLPQKGETVEQAARRQREWSTGAKVAVGGAAAGGLAVGGVVLGEHLSGGAISDWAAGSPELAAAADWVEDAAGDVAEWAAPIAADVGGWAEGAAEDVAAAASDAGEAVAGAAEDLGGAALDALPEDVADDIADWLGAACSDAGDFVMDLF